jgi:hypothetical protein
VKDRWYGLVWIGMDWYGLVWIGMDWYGLARVPGLSERDADLIRGAFIYPGFHSE